MRINEFLRLVPVFEFENDEPATKERGAYTAYIPLQDFIDAMQRNGLEIKNRRITPWSISADLSSITDLGCDEAHDLIQPIMRQRGRKS